MCVNQVFNRYISHISGGSHQMWIVSVNYIKSQWNDINRRALAAGDVNDANQAARFIQTQSRLPRKLKIFVSLCHSHENNKLFPKIEERDCSRLVWTQQKYNMTNENTIFLYSFTEWLASTFTVLKRRKERNWWRIRCVLLQCSGVSPERRKNFGNWTLTHLTWALVSPACPIPTTSCRTLISTATTTTFHWLTWQPIPLWCRCSVRPTKAKFRISCRTWTLVFWMGVFRWPPRAGRTDRSRRAHLGTRWAEGCWVEDSSLPHLSLRDFRHPWSSGSRTYELWVAICECFNIPVYHHCPFCRSIKGKT